MTQDIRCAELGTVADVKKIPPARNATRADITPNPDPL